MQINENIIYDFIIIGSGPGAVIAASTLVDAGKNILMIDGGNQDSKYQSSVNNENFVDLRQNDSQQYKYFLGYEFEAIPSSEVKTGAQLTPSRKHVVAGIDQWCPILSEDFSPMESLAYGGLGTGWGLGAYVYSDEELEKAGLPIPEMRDSYQFVADKIGISCGNDDISSSIASGLKGLQPSIEPDNSVKILLEKYEKRKSWFKNRNIIAGLPSLALLTKPIENRESCDYNDMDFYHDKTKAAWRPAIEIDRLKTRSNFNYLPGHFALSFHESEDSVEVLIIRMDTMSKLKLKAYKLMLGAGALGSARIVLRSLPVQNLPVLCNPYTYMPAINLKMIGKTLIKRKTSMAQAMLLYNPDKTGMNIVSVAIYTYRSLLLMRLIQESPLNIAANRKIFKWLYPAFIIAGIHHPDYGNSKRKMVLEANTESKTGDALKVEFFVDNETKKRITQGEKNISKAMKKMGVFPIKKLNPGMGSSIHYGGTLPVSDSNTPGYTSCNGKLYGTNSVYSVDGAAFKYLPAKGITLSIMANAHRVAKSILKNE